MPTGVAKLARKIVSAIIVIPLAVVIIAFAIANRQIVTVSFDPFSVTEPAAVVALPLFALIILLLIIGVLMGRRIALGVEGGGVEDALDERGVVHAAVGRDLR